MAPDGWVNPALTARPHRSTRSGPQRSEDTRSVGAARSAALIYVEPDSSVDAVQRACVDVGAFSSQQLAKVGVAVELVGADQLGEAAHADVIRSSRFGLAGIPVDLG